MPLRDHFHSPVDDKHSWDELHGGWPMMIVQHLYGILPEGYVAAPGVHLGATFEIDVTTYESGESDGRRSHDDSNGGVATWAPPKPTLSVETDLPEQDEYEVKIYDARRGRRLVAAIEIVSPSNKDRPDSRATFVAKVAALLREGVCVSIVDLVTVRQFNLYAQLLALLGNTDPHLTPEPPHLYAVTVRGRKRARKRPLLDTWFYPMVVGQELPTLPLWLDVDVGVFLPLETSYEETCRLLHIA